MRNNDNHDTSPAATTTPALKSTTALITVAGLKTILGGIDRSAALQSGRPMLQFKSREDGTWRYGIKGNEVEEGSQWAINVLTFMHGYICFGPDNKVIGERMVPSREPKPDFASLPNLGARWQDQTTVDVKCCTGTDAGVEATLKMTSDGGGKFMANLVVAIDNRAANLPEGSDEVVPVLELGRDSYQHKTHGKIWTPEFTIAAWLSLNSPAPAAPGAPLPPPAPPTPPPPPAAAGPASDEPQPRRRRVA